MNHAMPAHHFAKHLGLSYACDSEHGFHRRRKGKGFVYVDHRGAVVKNAKVLDRIKALVIPPAWQDVWICRHELGHLQVTGRDARGRKQYRYHADWSQSRNQNKFEALPRFGQSLPAIRARIERDLSKPGLPRDKVLAAVIRAMELSRMRVGNDIYARENNSFGLTTIRNHHAQVKGHRIRFRFKGKSGVDRDLEIADPRLSRIVRRCQDLPGQELFGYQDDHGRARDIGSGDVNSYLKEISGESVTAKDFRTWGGTVKAIEILLTLGPLEDETKTARKKRECEVIKEVAKYLGNTVAVCRKYYVDPRIFAADQDGRLYRPSRRKISNPRSFSKTEKILLGIL